MAPNRPGVIADDRGGQKLVSFATHRTKLFERLVRGFGLGQDLALEAQYLVAPYDQGVSVFGALLYGFEFSQGIGDIAWRCTLGKQALTHCGFVNTRRHNIE